MNQLFIKMNEKCMNHYLVTSDNKAILCGVSGTHHSKINISNKTVWTGLTAVGFYNWINCYDCKTNQNNTRIQVSVPLIILIDSKNTEQTKLICICSDFNATRLMIFQSAHFKINRVFWSECFVNFYCFKMKTFHNI